MNPKESTTPEIDWQLCTFEGAEREQLRRWSRLSLIQKLSALEEMCDFARETIAWRKAKGLPYFDPATGELVTPADSASRAIETSR